MDDHYTLLILSQHYPVSQQLQIISYEDVSIDTDVAEFLQAAEQQIGQHVLDSICTFAATTV